MAVHPEPALKESSFDLRLEALMQRKRALTRDLFLPPEANEADLAGLFDDVSLSRPLDPLDLTRLASEDAPGAASFTELAVDAATLERPPRATLSLPKTIEKTGARVWVLAAHEPRPTKEILAIFAGKTVKRMTISDPYALATPSNREAQIRFASDISEIATLRSVVVEYAPDARDEEEEPFARRDIGARFAASSAARKGATFMPVRRPQRNRADDFHDRQVTLELESLGGAVRSHTLIIGRGLTALYEDRWQCSVSYAPPT